MTSAFQSIYETIIAKAPQLAPKSTYAIHEWLAAGYDLEKDILPAVEETLKRGTLSIKSFAFFTMNIQRKNEQRIKAKTLVIDRTQQELDAIRAKAIKWHQKRGLVTTRIGHQDYDWLAKYEQKHGEVQP